MMQFAVKTFGMSTNTMSKRGDNEWSKVRNKEGGI